MRYFTIFSYALLICGCALLPVLTQAAEEVKDMKKSSLQASAEAAKTWLEIVDKGNYSQSWDQGSALMKMTISKDEWEKVMNAMRKPLGGVNSREVVDQRTAKNPQGLPPGDYMVMFYKTSFSKKAGASELVTLFFEDGAWHVMTYQVN